jgi:hypothetical protein
MKVKLLLLLFVESENALPIASSLVQGLRLCAGATAPFRRLP